MDIKALAIRRADRMIWTCFSVTTALSIVSGGCFVLLIIALVHADWFWVFVNFMVLVVNMLVVQVTNAKRDLWLAYKDDVECGRWNPQQERTQ